MGPLACESPGQQMGRRRGQSGLSLGRRRKKGCSSLQRRPASEGKSRIPPSHMHEQVRYIRVSGRMKEPSRAGSKSSLHSCRVGTVESSRVSYRQDCRRHCGSDLPAVWPRAGDSGALAATMSSQCGQKDGRIRVTSLPMNVLFQDPVAVLAFSHGLVTV